MKNQILAALYAHAEGKINYHTANVEVYLSNPAGIGDHSNVLSAVEQELAEISKYHDQIEVLDRYFDAD